MRIAVMLAAVLTLVATASPARAQDAAAAEAAFRDGRELMAQENYAEACEKFALSHRLDPAMTRAGRSSSCSGARTRARAYRARPGSGTAAAGKTSRARERRRRRGTATR